MAKWGQQRALCRHMMRAALALLHVLGAGGVGGRSPSPALTLHVCPEPAPSPPPHPTPQRGEAGEASVGSLRAAQLTARRHLPARRGRDLREGATVEVLLCPRAEHVLAEPLHFTREDSGALCPWRRCAGDESAGPVKTDDDRLVTTNLPVLRWSTTIAAAANSSAFRIVVKEAATQAVHWDSGWAWRENPKQPNATTWPVSATTYAGPALAPSTKYAWSVEEKDPDASASSRTYRSSFTTAAGLPTAVEEARRALHSTQRLYDGQLSNLLARVGGDGYLSTSVYGGYTGSRTLNCSC